MTPHQSQWTFGASTLQRVVESEEPLLSPFEIFPDCTQAHLDANRDWLMPRFQDPQSGILAITIQSFLVRQNGLTILVDSCGGNDKERARPHFHRRAWPWLDRLREAGVDARGHRHRALHASARRSRRLEHAAGERPLGADLSQRALSGRATRMGPLADGGPAALVRTGDFITDSVLPMFDSGQAELIGDEHALNERDRHRGRARPYARPVHVAAPRRRQRSDPVLRPDASSVAASLSGLEHALLRRSGAGARTRASFLNEHADTGRLIFPTHFPSPTGCTIERDGAGLRFHVLRRDRAQIGRSTGD